MTLSSTSTALFPNPIVSNIICFVREAIVYQIECLFDCQQYHLLCKQADTTHSLRQWFKYNWYMIKVTSLSLSSDKSEHELTPFVYFFGCWRNEDGLMMLFLQIILKVNRNWPPLCILPVAGGWWSYDAVGTIHPLVFVFVLHNKHQSYKYEKMQQKNLLLEDGLMTLLAQIILRIPQIIAPQKNGDVDEYIHEDIFIMKFDQFGFTSCALL